MNDRERIIEAARLQRTMLRTAAVFVLALTVLVWSLRQSWDWVTFAAIPATLISVLAVEAANIALQVKMRWHWEVIGFQISLLVGIGVFCLIGSGIGSAATMVPLLIIFDCIFVNMYVTKALARAGVRVGFLGASEEELRRLRSGVCLFCGYDLAGLPTAVCPECGKASVLGRPAEVRTS